MSTLSRRRLLALGAIGGAAIVAGCSKGDEDEEEGEIERLVPTATTTPPKPKPTPADLDAVTTLATETQRVVATYGAVEASVAAGAIAGASAPFTALIAVAKKHHQAHADALNGVLTQAGRAAVAGAASSAPAATTSRAAHELLIDAEAATAAKYLTGIGAITDPGTLLLVSTIRPVGLQVAAALRFLNGQPPSPAAFA